MHITRAAKALRNAFLSRGFLLFGPRFARDYLRFAAAAAPLWGTAEPGMAHMLGYRVPYPNQIYALFLIHEIFVDATYAFERRRGRPRVVDCGANIGMSVVFFKAYAPGASILAIEPEPVTFAHLRETMTLNEIDDVELLNAAVARTEGTVRFYSNPADPGGLSAGLYPALSGDAGQEVRAIRLSSVIDKPVDFLKLDVEGAEYEVVDDLIESGAIGRVHEIVVETHEFEERPGGRDRIAAKLRDAGFVVRLLRDAPTMSIVHGIARRTGVQSPV
jgi:FkbM family methyltransferase